jgi:trans-L-3-hydroxyproline dehydratase
MSILQKIKDSKVKNDFFKLKTIDMHTGGEPLRVIIDGYPEIIGNTILEKRNYVKNNLDYLRTSLMFEPRGHADMYGVLLVEPENKDSDFGVIFMHNEGYSTMCGHATIAITKLAVELGWLEVTKPVTNIKIDAPCGQLDSYAKIDNDGNVTSVSFNCVPSFVVALNETIDVEGIGQVIYDLSYGGAFYAYIDAESIGLSLDKDNYDKIITYGKKIKQSIIKNKDNIIHPFEDDLSFLYGIIFITKSNEYHSKNVCVFADGEVDRSSTGSGVSGRAAIHYLKNEIKINESITIESILGSLFDVKVVNTRKYGNFDSVIPQVTGNAYITGEHTFLIDKNDDLKHGFFLR